MAVSFVNKAVATNGTTGATSIAVSYSPTAGNYVVVIVSLSATVTSPSVKDQNSNALTVSLFNSGKSIIAYGAAVSGATTYTASWTTSADASICIGEYSGVVGVGTTNSATGSSTTISVSLTSTFLNSWAVCGMTQGSGTNTFTASVGNLRCQEQGGSATANTCAINDNSGTSIGSSIVNTCTCLSNSWSAFSVELYPTQTPAGVPPAQLFIGGSMI
jgi:hypothetical protein